MGGWGGWGGEGGGDGGGMGGGLPLNSLWLKFYGVRYGYQAGGVIDADNRTKTEEKEEEEEEEGNIYCGGKVRATILLQTPDAPRSRGKGEMDSFFGHI
eukprot:gene11986-8258_t